MSLVVGVNKPAGMSSHDVVNSCRRIFGEKRVGHTGTLDPMATGVLPICVGPATRLDAYLVGHDKRYRVRIVFGVGTTTDDAEGDVVREGAVPPQVLDPAYAEEFVAGLIGARKQMPPAYSAIKVNGKKAYEAARSGTIIDLKPRDIEVYEACLLGIDEAGEQGYPAWNVECFVSKGTYIRALARDVGVALGCPAHVGALQRTQLGSLSIEECVTLEALFEQGSRAALDPVSLLGCRFAYVEDVGASAVRNGAPFPGDRIVLFERRTPSVRADMCACTAGVRESRRAPEPDEIVAIIADNRLIALYAYDEQRDGWTARCVFAVGVSRGKDI